MREVLFIFLDNGSCLTATVAPPAVVPLLFLKLFSLFSVVTADSASVITLHVGIQF